MAGAQFNPSTVFDMCEIIEVEFDLIEDDIILEDAVAEDGLWLRGGILSCDEYDFLTMEGKGVSSSKRFVLWVLLITRNHLQKYERVFRFKQAGKFEVTIMYIYGLIFCGLGVSTS